MMMRIVATNHHVPASALTQAVRGACGGSINNRIARAFAPSDETAALDTLSATLAVASIAGAIAVAV